MRRKILMVALFSAVVLTVGGCGTSEVSSETAEVEESAENGEAAEEAATAEPEITLTPELTPEPILELADGEILPTLVENFASQKNIDALNEITKQDILSGTGEKVTNSYRIDWDLENDIVSGGTADVWSIVAGTSGMLVGEDTVYVLSDSGWYRLNDVVGGEDQLSNMAGYLDAYRDLKSYAETAFINEELDYSVVSDWSDSEMSPDEYYLLEQYDGSYADVGSYLYTRVYINRRTVLPEYYCCETYFNTDTTPVTIETDENGKITGCTGTPINVWTTQYTYFSEDADMEGDIYQSFTEATTVPGESELMGADEAVALLQ